MTFLKRTILFSALLMLFVGAATAQNTTGTATSEAVEVDAPSDVVEATTKFKRGERRKALKERSTRGRRATVRASQNRKMRNSNTPRGIQMRKMQVRTQQLKMRTAKLELRNAKKKSRHSKRMRAHKRDVRTMCESSTSKTAQ